MIAAPMCASYTVRLHSNFILRSFCPSGWVRSSIYLSIMHEYLARFISIDFQWLGTDAVLMNLKIWQHAFKYRSLHRGGVYQNLTQYELGNMIDPRTR